MLSLAKWNNNSKEIAQQYSIAGQTGVTLGKFGYFLILL